MKDSSKVLLTLSLSLLLVPFSMTAGGGNKKQKKSYAQAAQTDASLATTTTQDDQQEEATSTDLAVTDQQDNATAQDSTQDEQAAITADATNTDAVQEEPVAEQVVAKKAFQMFSQTAAEYAPRDAYVPEQATFFGVKPFSGGYTGVLAEVKAIKDALQGAKREDTRKNVGNALRDIIGYLDRAITAKDLGLAKSYVVSLQELALAAQEKGVMPEDRRDNVVAWINSYVNEVAQLEAQRVAEIKDLYANNDSQFDWKEVATKLGLKLDAEQAVSDFAALTIDDIKESRTEFKASATRLLEYLTQQAHKKDSTNEGVALLTHAQKVVKQSSDLSIPCDQEALVALYKEAEAEKQKVLAKTRKLMKEGLKLAAELNAIEHATRATTEKHYAADIVAQLGQADTTEYNTNNAVRALFNKQTSK